MPSPKQTYAPPAAQASLGVKEEQVEYGFIGKLQGLKYEYRPDIRDRAALERNFREKFEALNRVHLSDGEFARLLDEVVTADVYTAARMLRERNAFTREDGTPLNYTLVNTKDWCKNSFEVVNQLRINTDIVTTHHLGLFSILSDWITKGEKSDKFKKNKQPLYKLHILSLKSGELELENCRNDVFLYHLRLLQLLSLAHKSKDVRAYHFALLRQVLENVASFLGVGQFSYVLNQIGITEPNRVADIVNALSHKKVYYYESDIVVPDNLSIFDEVMGGLHAKYKFVMHAE